MEGHNDNKLYIVAVWFIVNPLLNKDYYYYHYYLYSVQIVILSKSCISLEQPLTQNCGLLHLVAVQPSRLQD